MNDEKVKVAFEATILQIATISNTVKPNVKPLVSEEAIMALLARVVASQASKKVSEAPQQCIVASLPSAFFFRNGSSSFDVVWKARKTKNYLRRNKKVFFFSLEKQENPGEKVTNQKLPRVIKLKRRIDLSGAKL